MFLSDSMTCKQNSIWVAIWEQEEEASEEQLQVEGSIIVPSFFVFNLGYNYYVEKNKERMLFFKRGRNHFMTTSFNNMNCTCVDNQI